jgi:transcriptional repressor NrdR
MRCPACHAPTHVRESRPTDEGATVRRRRECSECDRRFTTYERYEQGLPSVRKRDGSRQPFDRAKLLGGLLRAIHKRPVPRADAEALADRIEVEIVEAGGELPAQRVGELLLEGLRELDRVAYLQAVAVYRGFDDPSDFSSELASIGAGSVRPDGEDPELPPKAA